MGGGGGMPPDPHSLCTLCAHYVACYKMSRPFSSQLVSGLSDPVASFILGCGSLLKK